MQKYYPDFDLDSLYRIHLEPTSKCNLLCPMCPRSVQGASVRKTLELTEISLNDFKSWFSPFINKVTRWVMCGGTGDPCVAKDMLKIIEYIKTENNDTWIHMNTNGGIRTPKYYKELGKYFPKNEDKGQVIFSIDGLEDTNHFYRRNNNWGKVMENSQAFIDGGGKAEWEFLIFKHNEHQIDEARRLSKEMGFTKFIAKKALGFQHVKDGVPIPHPVYNKKGDLEYLLEAPTDDNNRNMGSLTEIGGVNIHQSIPLANRHKWDKIFMDSILDFDPITARTEPDYERRVNISAINCKVLGQPQNPEDKHEIYITAQGLVMPCCWIGTIYYVPSNWFEIVQMQQVIKKFGEDKISLYKNTLEEVYNSGYFDIFKNSWDKENIRCGKLGYCATTCGENNQIDDIWTHEKNERG